MPKFFPKIRRNEDGVTIVEFALITPTLLFMLMGLFELGHGMYVQSIVKGVMQDAGRDATLETAQQIDMYNLVSKKVKEVAPNADVTLNWYNFGSYTEIGALEDYTDTNGDGQCSKDEPFEDLNENGVHDYYDGQGGIGEARDAVVFRTKVEYDRMFPMPTLAGWTSTNTVEGITVLRNQPYRDVNKAGPPVGKCTGMETYDTSCSSAVSGIGINCTAGGATPGSVGKIASGAATGGAGGGVAGLVTGVVGGVAGGVAGTVGSVVSTAPAGTCHDHGGTEAAHCH